ncbi:PP2C family protein-serine/threonine phosphatase [Actinokineospora bangkokensis]|uniref:PPM-type phosphatase domain-containing protein n=1 Tax=Actinokineospora bangkokensis TaxID=1193682 RepID=A0A1Q9LC28_9PSEU|nr:protein phosphatase 2C domain-containing protein [Actinokineospora bangkokensis]OLR89566.1 hypothetical protein BJP25_05685 [Actinokineospora bangkokensis]
MDMRFAAATCTALGARETNEDSAAAGSHVLALADGVGGAPAGEVASAVAVTAAVGAPAGTPPQELVRAANQAVRAHARAHPETEGMAATLEVVALVRTAAGWAVQGAHLGDSTTLVQPPPREEPPTAAIPVQSQTTTELPVPEPAPDRPLSIGDALTPRPAQAPRASSIEDALAPAPGAVDAQARPPIPAQRPGAEEVDADDLPTAAIPVQSFGIVRMGRPHTLAEEMLAAGLLSQEEAAKHPNRSALMRAIGLEAEAVPELWSHAAVVGTRYLLSSDGLFDALSTTTVHKLLESFRADAPEDVARMLVESACAAGARDNVTVVVAEVVAE